MEILYNDFLKNTKGIQIEVEKENDENKENDKEKKEDKDE
jgi:hypothetical protein